MSDRLGDRGTVSVGVGGDARKKALPRRPQRDGPERVRDQLTITSGKRA
jgi:hypothetical protein